MYRELLKQLKRTMSTVVGGVVLLYFLIGNANGADDPDPERDLPRKKQTARSSSSSSSEAPSADPGLSRNKPAAHSSSSSSSKVPSADPGLSRNKPAAHSTSSRDAVGPSPELPHPRKKQAAQSVAASSAADSAGDRASSGTEHAARSQLQANPVVLDLVDLDKIILGSRTPPGVVLRTCLISHLPRPERSVLRLVSRRYRDYIDLTFFGPVYDPQIQVTAFSSEISGGRIGENILNLVRTAQRRVIIASDKCTNEEFLDDLLTLRGTGGGPLEIRITTGEDRQTQDLLSKPKYSGIVSQLIQSNRDRSGKMHNKFIIVDDELVITGSPNLTFAAYNYNVESFVAIRHRFVAGLYFRYYQYIISGKDKYDRRQDEYRRVGKMMHVFNTAPDNPIQVCLAPIFDIKTFVTRELDASQIIDINMFLISRTAPATQGNDIIANLVKAAGGGANISIKVDGEQYERSEYMSVALKPLRDIGQSIYTVVKRPESMLTRTRRINTIPQFHDKLVLIMHRDGSKKVFIGSAGFTDNVQDNLNLENMVLLRIAVVYDLLLGHFTAVDGTRGNLVVTKL